MEHEATGFLGAGVEVLITSPRNSC